MRLLLVSTTLQTQTQTCSIWRSIKNSCGKWGLQQLLALQPSQLHTMDTINISSGIQSTRSNVTCSSR